MERLSFYNCDKFSTAIFRALPRKGTFFTDRQFPECFRATLGLPSPTFTAFSQQYIGTKTPKPVDPFGIGIANATLPHDHWRQRHDSLKRAIADALTTSKNSVLVEPGSMFNGKIPSAIYQQFLAKNLRVTPDILIPHFNNSKDWACDVKIHNVYSDFSNYISSYSSHSSKSPRMVDHSGPDKVRSSYLRVTTKLDKEIANHPPTATTPGPFTTALHSLHDGHITPIIGGAFGECSKTLDNLLKHISLQAAANNAGLQLTPHCDISPILSARNILLHDFRQVIGCTVIKANIDCKLKRLPFIRSTATDAKAIASLHTKQNTNPFSFDFNSWFRNTGDNGTYDTFYRYLNLQGSSGNFLSDNPDWLDSRQGLT